MSDLAEKKDLEVVHPVNQDRPMSLQSASAWQEVQTPQQSYQLETQKGSLVVFLPKFQQALLQI